MTMTATVKLMNFNDNEIAEIKINSEAYIELTCEGFVEKAWAIADKMAAELSESDEWRLTMTVDLDLRECAP